MVVPFRDRFVQIKALIRWCFQILPNRIIVSDNGKTVVFVQLLPNSTVALVEALYAAALALRGCRSIVLLKKRSFSSLLVSLIFRAACNSRSIYIDSYLTSELYERAASLRTQFVEAIHINGQITVSLFDSEILYRSVLSRVARELRVGSIDVRNQSHLSVLESVFFESTVTSLACKTVISALSPDHAVFCEKGYTPQGEVYDACMRKNVDVIQWISAPVTGYLIFKRYRRSNFLSHPLSVSRDTLNRATLLAPDNLDIVIKSQISSHYKSNAWFNRQQLNVGKKTYSKEEVCRILGVRPGVKIAVIFSHIFYDATFFYGTSLYKDYQTWLVETVRAAMKNDNLDWFIKVHPVNLWRSRMDGVEMENLEEDLIRRNFPSLPAHIKFIYADTDISTYSLFNVIDYGITVRGTIGMELPCYGVPVITAGTGRYSGLGFTCDFADPVDYQKCLHDLHIVPRLDQLATLKALRHAYASMFLKPFRVSTFKINYSCLQSVDVEANSIRKSIRTGDLAKIGLFILNGKDEDLTTYVSE